MSDYSNVNKDGELVSNNSWRNTIIAKSEIYFTIIFTIEFILKIGGLGFFGKKGYLHDRWNWLDFIVVLTGWISYLPGVPNISAIRTFRVIRPLKSISTNPGLQHLVTSIINSIPELVSVLILLGFVFILFGIAGVQLFSGPQLHTRCRLTPYPVKLTWSPGLPYEPYRCLNASNFDKLEEKNWKKSESPWSKPQNCYWPVDTTQPSFCGLNHEGMYQCIHNVISKEKWTWCGSNYDALGNPRFIDSKIMNEATFISELNWGFANYDNIGEAFLTVFQAITMEGWSDLMYFSQDSVNQYYGALLYVTLILFGSFFCLNLLLAVLEDNFTHSKSDNLSNKTTWKKIVLKFMLWIKYDQINLPDWYIDLQLYYREHIVHSQIFNGTVTFFIIINTIILALDYYPQDPQLSNILDVCNFVISFIFIFEMFIKIFSLGFFYYISDIMNVFDSLIVISSFIEMITSPPVYFGGNQQSTSGTISALRGFRLFRIFKLVTKWESMKLLLSKVFKTITDLGNFAILLSLILFIYTLIGMQFFSNRFRFDSDGYPIKEIGSYEWRHAENWSRSNFDDFTHAFATVFQILTTENWNNVMYDCRKTYGAFAVVYPCSLIIIGDYIFMNLFLAILIGNFSNNEVIESDNSDISSSDDSEQEIELQQYKRLQQNHQLQLQLQHQQNHQLAIVDPHRRKTFFSFIKPSRITPQGNIQINNNSNHSSNNSNSNSNNNSNEFQPSTNKIHHYHNNNHNHNHNQLQSHDSYGSIPESDLNSIQENHSEPSSTIFHNSINNSMNNNNNGSNINNIRIKSNNNNNNNDDINDTNSTIDENEINSDDIAVGPISSPATESIFPLYPSYTLGLFGPDHPIRHFCADLISNKKFDQWILVLIVVSSITLALDNPLNNPDSLQSIVLNWFDLILTLLFSLEMIIKIIALGLIFGESAYLRSYWNVLDCIVVIISLIGLFSGTNSNLTSLRSLRALRALRPFRVINRAPGLKLVVNSMLSSIPDVMNVVTLCFLFFLIFSIFCVNYFKGMLRSCGGEVFHNSINTNPSYLNLLTYPKYWSHLTEEEKSWFGPNSTVTYMNCNKYNFPYEPCCSTYPISEHNPITSRMLCECWGGSWNLVNTYQFDNVGQALLALFQMSTTEGWVTLMYTLVDTSGIDMQPIRDNHIEWIYFCIFFMLVGSYLALNIFVGVVIDNFNKMKAKVDGNLAFLTPEQQEWIHTQEIIKRLKPIKKPKRPTFWLTNLIYDICLHNWFEWFIMYSIIFNTIIMAMVYFGQDTLYGKFLDRMNTVFAGIFTIETIFKLIILKFHYFEDNWNKFDFIVVLGTNIGFLYLYLSGSNIGLIVTILRTFRIARLLRLMNGTEKINQLLNTLLLTLPGLGNIGALLFLLFFIYGVMGVQLFAKIEYNGTYNAHTNFRNFGTALLSLFRFSTGESWNNFMYDTSERLPNCVNDPPYNSSYCGFSDHTGCIPLNGCGSISIFPFMISFTIIISVVFINLFVGVILQGFSSSDDSNKTIKTDNYIKFCEHWTLYDPQATCYITIEQLEPFILTLFEPLGFDNKPNVTKREIQNRIGAMNLHIFKHNKVHFRDVLSGLSTEAIKRATRKDDNETNPISLLPQKKFGWSGYHSKLNHKKKRLIDEYLGILPDNTSHSTLSEPTYTPDQYYALRRFNIQMARLGIILRKKRENIEGSESPFIQSNAINQNSLNPFQKNPLEDQPKKNDSSTDPPLPEYVKSRVLVRLRSQSEKDKIQKDNSNILNEEENKAQIQRQVQTGNENENKNENKNENENEKQKQLQVPILSLSSPLPSLLKEKIPKPSKTIESNEDSKYDSTVDSNRRKSLKSEVKTEKLNTSMNESQLNNQINETPPSQSESKNSVNIVESHKENDNVPYFLTESTSGTNIRLPPLDPHPHKLRAIHKTENPIRSKSNRKKKDNENHILI